MIKYMNIIRLLLVIFSVPAQSSHYTPNSRNGKCCETSPSPWPLCPFPGRNSWRHRIHCLKPNIDKQFYSPSHMPWPLLTSTGPKLLEDGWVEDSWLNNFSGVKFQPHLSHIHWILTSRGWRCPTKPAWRFRWVPFGTLAFSCQRHSLYTFNRVFLFYF